MSEPTILLAVGHGGRDSGATGNGLKEKNLTLPTALFCEEYLKTLHTGFTVELTRRRDKFVSLNQQVSMAMSIEADLVVDIHYNSFYLSRAHGMETFIAKNQRTNSNKRAQRKIHDSLASCLSEYDIYDRGMKQSRHYLIRNLGNDDIDAVLVEGLFISNPREADLIRNEAVQKEVGYAIGRGIARHFNLLEKPEHTWGHLEMPEVVRPIGVELEGEKTYEIGFLARDPVTDSWQTYIRSGFAKGKHIKDVTGHGDHIKIATK